MAFLAMAGIEVEINGDFTLCHAKSRAKSAILRWVPGQPLFGSVFKSEAVRTLAKVRRRQGFPEPRNVSLDWLIRGDNFVMPRSYITTRFYSQELDRAQRLRSAGDLKNQFNLLDEARLAGIIWR